MWAAGLRPHARAVGGTTAGGAGGGDGSRPFLGEGVRGDLRENFSSPGQQLLDEIVLGFAPLTLLLRRAGQGRPMR